MAFYLKPPRGDIQLEKLLELATMRIEFLELLQSSGSHEEFRRELEAHGHLSESVWEGSSKDRISHFILRLAVSSSGSRHVLPSFLDWETRLFSYRLQALGNEESASRLEEVERHLNCLSSECPEDEEVALASLRDSVGKILKGNMLFDEDCPFFRVPFQTVPDLVRKRLVNLEAGMASITKSVLPDYLCGVFKAVLCRDTRSIGQMNYYGNEPDDGRVENLVRQVLAFFESKIEAGLGRVSEFSFGWKDVDDLVANNHFPPCFARVHRKLLEEKRLGHHCRVAYTLFLKEIGLSAPEAIGFWSHHYEKPSSGGSSCSHSWQSHERKFTYSIRHLYGESGSRKDYSAHSCQSIIDIRSPTGQLSCPLNVQDIEDLTNVAIPTLGSEECEDIVQRLKNIEAESQKPSEIDFCTTACSRVLAKRIGLVDEIRFQKPSAFFNLSCSHRS